jgi:hypothetical protein
MVDGMTPGSEGPLGGLAYPISVLIELGKKVVAWWRRG